MKYKDLDKFLDEHFIPNHVEYRKIDSDDPTDQYEKCISLYYITRLRLSDEDKNYIVEYLNDKGIKISGHTSTMNFETDKYLDIANYVGYNLPESLTKEETLEKFKLYNETHNPKIREEIILGNMRLVWHVLNNMHIDYSLNKYDLMQTGCEGLMCAVDRFDLSKGLAFSTFAGKYIEGYIRDEIHLQQGIRTTDRPMFRIMKSTERELGESILGNPKVVEQVLDKIADKGLRSDINRDENLRRVMLLSPVSLESVLEDNEDEEFFNLGYEVQDSNIGYLYDAEAKETIREALESLPKREKEILIMRFGLDGKKPHTFQEIGDKYGLTAYGANLNVRSSCKKLSPKVRSLSNYSYKEI